jgi:hypothetical protein
VETDRALAFTIVRLRADATMQALVAARIGNAPAAAGTQYPYVVLDVLSDGNDLRIVGGIRVWTDPLLLIKAVTKGNNPGQLAPIAKRIDQLLDAQSGTIADGVIVDIYRERGHLRRELTDGVLYLNMGGEYRYRVQQA